MQGEGEVLWMWLWFETMCATVQTSQFDSVLAVSHPRLQGILSDGGKVLYVCRKAAEKAV